jgi:hypothetical protein
LWAWFQHVRLAALRGEKAVTFHKQCGSGWLGPGRIYFQPQISQVNADRSTSTTESRRNPQPASSLLIIRFLFPYNNFSTYAAKRNNY